jgi:hypothetical protein
MNLHPHCAEVHNNLSQERSGRAKDPRQKEGVVPGLLRKHLVLFTNQP